MEASKKEKQMLLKALRECCMTADCEKLAKIFEVANWKWCNEFGEFYHPSAREIRHTLYELGTESFESLLHDYKTGEWDAEIGRPYTNCTGRLFFSIEFEPFNGEEYDIVDSARFACGINTEAAFSFINHYKDEDIFVVETFIEGEKGNIQTFKFDE